ncbi:Hypothetical protein Nlim_0649 [Candidatus Nitrosarchaeum limnium SFB1]|jgi:hypothetical protein|uniref:Uncharacterized protein n=1 Tax=Candidatus Nitrosarchaeum limnium SFB1 TaxID=886738 RepID=F3KJJ1_9ARCH|nr:Hypothetical protein Nlim_0649 [Candidatus Nitrosarchaeum limnium SFB1]
MTKKLLYIVLLTAMISISISSSQSYGETNKSFTKIDSNDINNNPITKNILKNIEIARKEYATMIQKEKEKDEHQKFIDSQRKAAQASLEEELSRMNTTYEEFTPRNAFAKYVSGVNSTYQGIYWDQFEYLNSKVTLANEAKNTVLDNGGTYFEAMKEYTTYATMPKIEMLNVIKDLNIKHSFTDKNTQSYFDANGKLPRFEDDLNSPCYGCEASISKIKASNKQIIPISIEKTKPITQSEQITSLKNKLSALQKDFVNSKDIIKQKITAYEMNSVVKQIQEFKDS